MNRLPLMISLAAALLAAPAEASALRGATVHVSSDIVTVADLFDGADATGQIEVAKAPAPGKTISLDSGTLYGIAVANHLDWRPAGLTQRVIVIRDGDVATGMPVATSMNFGAVVAPLTPALTAQGAGDKLAVLLDAGEQQHILSTLPANVVLAVDHLDFDASTRHFAATLTDAATGHRFAVTGRALAMIKVPVPTRRIQQGDAIRAEDIDYIDQRSDTLRSDTELKAAAMVGKVAKRQLEASQPVQERFLALPTLIKRGDRVTMIVHNAGILISAEGRAEGDAGLGEIIRLSNSATNKELEGVVTGIGTAEIRTDSTIIAASAASTSITR